MQASPFELAFPGARSRKRHVALPERGDIYIRGGPTKARFPVTVVTFFGARPRSWVGRWQGRGPTLSVNNSDIRLSLQGEVRVGALTLILTLGLASDRNIRSMSETSRLKADLNQKI